MKAALAPVTAPVIPCARLEPNSMTPLPAAARQMIVMRDVSGLSYAEIAETLDLELGTVKSRIARAREKLIAVLSEDETFRARAASKKRKEGYTHA